MAPRPGTRTRRASSRARRTPTSGPGPRPRRSGASSSASRSGGSWWWPACSGAAGPRPTTRTTRRTPRGSGRSIWTPSWARSASTTGPTSRSGGATTPTRRSSWTPSRPPDLDVGPVVLADLAHDGVQVLRPEPRGVLRVVLVVGRGPAGPLHAGHHQLPPLQDALEEAPDLLGLGPGPLVGVRRAREDALRVRVPGRGAQPVEPALAALQLHQGRVHGPAQPRARQGVHALHRPVPLV